jgi:predicted phage terminase large subunit-like protein
MPRKSPSEDEQQLLEIQKNLKLLKRQQAAMNARDDLIEFSRFIMPDKLDRSDASKSEYDPQLHHRAIAAALQEAEAGRLPFLILTMGPRMGKSQLTSKNFPAWFLGRHPDTELMVVTYNEDFATEFGSDVRNIILSPAYKQVFPGVSLTRGGTAKANLRTTMGGKIHFRGLGGTVTGLGASVLLMDDLIKSDREARSQTYRDDAWNFFVKVATTRLMPWRNRFTQEQVEPMVVMTFTRWHSDDIIGRLTDPENPHYSREFAEQIKVINFPAIAEENDSLGREPGEALWPSRFSLKRMQQQRALDPRAFDALYQGRPSVEDGEYFRREHFRYYGPDEPTRLPPLSELRVFCASDHAVSTDQRRDATAMVRVGVDKQNNIYVLDLWWKRAKTDEVVEAMLTMAKQEPKPLIWWAERGHISKSIGPFLRKRMTETQTFFNLVEVTPAGDKVQRAQSIIARNSMGHVFWPKGAFWTEKAINELLSFPNGLHDDVIDCMAYIGLGLQSQFPVKRAETATSEPKYGTLAWVKQQQRQDALANASKKYGVF